MEEEIRDIRRQIGDMEKQIAKLEAQSMTHINNCPGDKLKIEIIDVRNCLSKCKLDVQGLQMGHTVITDKLGEIKHCVDGLGKDFEEFCQKLVIPLNWVEEKRLEGKKMFYALLFIGVTTFITLAFNAYTSLVRAGMVK